MERPLERKKTHRVDSLDALDELVGKYILGETPETCWQDPRGLFSFPSEAEAREALLDPYYQLFLPSMEVPGIELRCVKWYQPYAKDIKMTWLVVEKLAPTHGALQVAREGNAWEARFGQHGSARAANVSIAICLAALLAQGMNVALNSASLIKPNDLPSPQK